MILPRGERLANGLAVIGLLPAYIAYGCLKHVVPLKRLARWAWRRPRGGRRDREAERLLAARVLRASRLVGASDRDCLQRSLLLYHKLSQAGAEPKLLVGFRRVDGQTIGHAWVAVDGRPVIEGDAEWSDYAAIQAFGARGELVCAPAQAGGRLPPREDRRIWRALRKMR